MKKLWILIIAGMIQAGACTPPEEQSGKLPALSISENGRQIETADGEPFFWLGDTGWLLLRKPDRDEAVFYLENRAAKGFNVIQLMVIHDLNRCTNFAGDSAVTGKDISRPLVSEGNDPSDEAAYDFWDHLDYVISLAEKNGLYMAMVPIWGSNVKANPWTVDQATAYGTFLAERYGDRSNVIWLNGGDTRGDENTEFWLALGKALKQGAPGQLVTFHPFGRMRSADWFHEESWLDFNMFQSGHRRYDQDDTERAYGQDNWRYVKDDYVLDPVRPTLDGEPSYEGIPQGLHDTTQPLWNDADLRRYAYWSVFSGACGFTYGHREVMQFYRPGQDDPAYGAILHWKEALEAPGAGQMVHLKELMLSGNWKAIIPDQGLLAGDEGERYNYIAACRGEDRALLYTFTGREMEVNMGIIKGSAVSASWFDPRTGQYQAAGEYENSGKARFDPPGEQGDGNDRVLVLESKN